MHVELITPDKKVFEGQAVSVKMPGSLGGLEVLNNHAALISSLAKGKVVITTDKGEEYMIDGGVAEVRDNKVIILAETLLAQ